MWKWCTAVF
jgi:uncharacterized membrane protein YwaF